MANFIVTTTADTVADDGVTSLREALVLADAAAGADTITFDAGLSGQTITLGGSQLILTSDVTIDGDIDGDNAADITISGDGVSRVFSANGGTSSLHALTITGGNGGGSLVYGGGLVIFEDATVHVTNSSFTGNSAITGGGIANFGIATITNSTVSGNFGRDVGGGIYNSGTLDLTNGTISGNFVANNYGGGIANYGFATIANSTISGNSSPGAGAGVLSFGTTELINSIVLGNYSGRSARNVSGGNLTVTNSLIGTGPETVETVFAEIVRSTGGGLLADNGGPVQTIALLDDISNLALDSGNDALAPETDARGFARSDQLAIANNGTNISDLGAFELYVPPTGGPGPDVLNGNNGDDVLNGRGGDDQIFGFGGNDTLRGGFGADTVEGGDGDDTLHGDAGNDSLLAGSGEDTLNGGNGNDILAGGSDNDALNGGRGNDTLEGGTGDDALAGDNGNDTLAGRLGNDTLEGGAGRDELDGGNNDDTLDGGIGNDVLIGGTGNDILIGGVGADIFVFANNAGNDQILDFSATNNREDIDLSAVTRITDFDDLRDNHMTASGDDVIIDDGAGTVITLVDVDIAALGAVDFIF